MQSEQRLIFDEVAELYARVRPGYPSELIDDVLAYAGEPTEGKRMLEIGCGGGQATLAFALRVEVSTTTFEDYPLPAEKFDLVISAQAFHWVSEELRFSKTAGGRLTVPYVAHLVMGRRL